MARALICAALLALVLAACGGSDGERPASVQVFGDAEEMALYRQLVSAYEAQSGERVRLVEVGEREAHLARISTGFAGGRPPDAFLINYRNFASYAARGVLDPAEQRLGRAGAPRRADFYEPPLDAFEWRGRLQCLPSNASSLVVYFNRDLFRRAGLPDPDPDWRFEDFRDTAQRLTRGDVLGVGVDPAVVRLAPFVWAAGGDIVDDPDEPSRFTLDDPASERGLQQFLGLFGYRVTPTEEQVESEPLEAMFARGGLAMFLSSRREVPGLRAAAGFDWDVAHLPRDRRRASVLHSDAWCVARGEGAERAWRFVAWAAGPEGQRILAEGGRIVPSLRSVAESPAFLDPAERPRSSRVFLEAIPRMRRLPVAPAWPEIEDAADLALKRAYYEELEVGDAIARIREETDPLFARAVR